MFKWLTAILVDYDACRRIAYESVEDARKEGIDYIELRFSPLFMAEANGLDAAAVTEAVIDGVQAASRDHGVPANLIGILSRTYGPDICRQELDALLTHRDKLIALDLAGDEGNYPGIYLSSTSSVGVMPVGTSPFTLVKRPVRPACARRSMSSVQRELVTAFERLRMMRWLMNWQSAVSVLRSV